MNLLAPRYKVIADYPHNGYEVGEVINIEALPLPRTAVSHFNQYPHLFKKLEWWEERKPEEMPEYVKQVTGDVHKVTYTKEFGRTWMETKEKRTWGVVPNVMCFFEPSTKEEYDNYKKSSVCQ